MTSDPTGCIEVVVASVSDKVTVFRRLQGRGLEDCLGVSRHRSQGGHPEGNTEV